MRMTSKVKQIHQMMMLILDAKAKAPQRRIWAMKKGRRGKCRPGAPFAGLRLAAYQLAPTETPTTRGSSENTLVNSAEVGSVR